MLIKTKTVPAYYTAKGATFIGDSRELLEELPDGSVNLLITRPPFALRRQKEYGNLDQHEYIDWFLEFARIVYRKRRDDGSFVVDFGGAYMKSTPRASRRNRQSSSCGC